MVDIFSVFALHNGGECRSGQSEGKTYQAHGKSSGCHKGVGNYASNHVYHVKENGKHWHDSVKCRVGKIYRC